MTWQEADTLAQQRVIERARQRAEAKLYKHREHLRYLRRCLAYAERKYVADVPRCRAVVEECQAHVSARESALAQAQAMHVVPSQGVSFAPRVNFQLGWELVSLQDTPLRSWSREEYASLKYEDLRLLVTVASELRPGLQQKLREIRRDIEPGKSNRYYSMLSWLEANTYRVVGGEDIRPTAAAEERQRRIIDSVAEGREHAAHSALRAAAPYDVVMPALLQLMSHNGAP